MKICHMTSAHDSDDIRIFQKQCVSLAKDSSNEVYLVARGKSRNEKNVNVVGIGSVSGGRIKRILGTSKRIFEKAKEIDADIYEFHDPELMLYARKLKKLGKKVIFDSHENYKLQIKEKGYIPKIVRGLVAWTYAQIESYACKYIDAALFPTDDNPYIGKVKDCVTICNTPMLDELKTKRTFQEKEDSVCCVGTLSRDRGIEVLVDACYKANVKLVLGGNFSPEQFGEELKKKKSFSIVDYRGYCNRHEVNEIYDECLIGADTILDVGQYRDANTLSTKVYEYMIMGMPYITSNFPYNKTIIDEYNCGIYVEPSNPDEIAGSIIHIVTNRKDAEAKGINGRRLIEQRFNWSVDESRLFELYKKLDNDR